MFLVYVTTITIVSCKTSYNIIKIEPVKMEQKANISEEEKSAEKKGTYNKTTQAVTGNASLSYQVGKDNCVFKKIRFKDEAVRKKLLLGSSRPDMWLSEKAEALKALPKDKLGFYVDWVASVEDGLISPRGSLDPSVTEEEPFDLDILLNVRSPVRNNVCFPHSVHTFWLGCNNCHPEIFIEKRGANQMDMNMTKIIKGEYCGRCHGKVAFRVANNCERCHNTPK